MTDLIELAARTVSPACCVCADVRASQVSVRRTCASTWVINSGAVTPNASANRQTVVIDGEFRPRSSSETYVKCLSAAKASSS